jgi:hypothetical protein
MHYVITVQTKQAAYKLVDGKKQRRRVGCERAYAGDYLDFRYNKMIGNVLNTTAAGREELLFADRCRVGTLIRGGGFFLRMFGGKKKQAPDWQGRFLLLSRHALYMLSLGVNEESNKTQVNLFFRAPFDDIKEIVASSYADNVFALHLKNEEKKDLLVYCRRKVELFGLLSIVAANVRVTFKNEDEICINVKQKR